MLITYYIVKDNIVSQTQIEFTNKVRYLSNAIKKPHILELQISANIKLADCTE
jgi:hypothetical protein